MKGATHSVLRRIISLAAPPTFPGDHERTRQAGLLMPLIAMFIPVIIISVFALIFVFPAKIPSAVVIGVILVVEITSYSLMKRGHVMAACLVFTAATGIYITGVVILSGGMSGANISHYVALVVFVRLLFGTRASLIASGAILIVLSVIIALGMYGIVFPRIFPVPAIPSLFMFLFSLMIALTTVHVAVKRLDEAVALGLDEIRKRERMMDTLAERERKERELTARLTALNALINELARKPSFDDFIRHVIDGGKNVLGFPRISVWLFTDDTTAMTGTFGIDEAGAVRDERDKRVAMLSEDLPSRMLREGKSVHAADTALRDDTGSAVGKGENAVAPIIDGGRIIGAMCIDNLLTGTPFNEHDLSTLTLYAANVGHLYAIKRAEAALHSYADELVHSNQELKEFVSIVSHDLKEPLRTASSFALLFQKRFESLVDDKAQTYIRAIVEEADRMQKLVDALVSYARTGNRGQAFTAVDLNDIVASVITGMRQRIDESSTGISIDTLPVIQGDAVQLSQLFQNLIDNALKFRSREPLAIALSAAREDDGWHVTVRDNGIGFDQSQADSIFSVFRRLVSREYSGTGIGLAICKKVAVRHGGRIWATSSSEGSIFHIQFPFAENQVLHASR
ncbi:MAG: ATP-binding protein [Spirochaetota bacterium]